MTRIAFNAALLTIALLAVSVRAQQPNPGRLGPDAVSSTQPRLAAPSTQGASQNTEALGFSDVAEVPTDRNLLSDTAKESWYFVPSWSDRRSAIGPQPTSPAARGADSHAGRYRQTSPFILLDKTSRRWRTVAISHHAYEIYPVRQDPEDPSLIWFGCNDGGRNAIIDWEGFRTSGAVDDPLIFAGHPGGLGLIDTTRRTVTYFGPYRDLVGGRVYEFLFDKDAVWVWGRYHGASELNGLSRFDRRTRTFEPLPNSSHGFDDAWTVRKLTTSDAAVSLAVLEGGEWFNRYEFDKARRQWRQLRYGWVSSTEVPVFDQPDEKSKTIDVLQPGIHFGKQGHDHYGHPVVVLEEHSGWQRVMTCRDIVGWTKSGGLVDILEFFRLTLNSSAARQDRANDGPRGFLWRAHLYMSHDEIQKGIEILRNSPEATAVFKGLLDRQELGIKLARQRLDWFKTRRMSLR
jgi:hypothetical protein